MRPFPSLKKQNRPNNNTMDPFGLYEDLSLFNGELPQVEEVTDADEDPFLASSVWGQPPVLPIKPVIRPVVSVKPAAVFQAPRPGTEKPAHVALSDPQQGSGDLCFADLYLSPGLPDPESPRSAWLETTADLEILTSSQRPVNSNQGPVTSTLEPVKVIPDAGYGGNTAVPVEFARPEPSSHLSAVCTPVVDAGSLKLLEEIIYLNDEAMNQPTTTLSSAITIPHSDRSARIPDGHDLFDGFEDSELAELADISGSLDLGSTVLSPVSYTEVESVLPSSPPISPARPVHDVTSSCVSAGAFTVLVDSPSGGEVVVNCVDTKNDVSDSYLDESSDSLYAMIDDLNDEDYTPSQSAPVRSSRANYRSAPYSRVTKDVIPERKERKKAQNRTAANRYREKKRAERDEKDNEVHALQTRNRELHEQVDSMTKEIKYLKNLMADVIKARKKYQRK